ncbi:hypothetical protein CCAX7_42940 [Capsulimonas corticalis]|uniref:Uncharacterized protein n=1 Tax=Capsulimonas corticalis TaxID=2219043 RepID=A0A402CXL6_9BACT|nr:hypothetical protein [Capsulimonas corticalis]BDI32243.1 hypothetical protein CCAX7_42940 [Capsulimonas corticalis]
MPPDHRDLLRQTAEKVDTGTEASETSRAFVVFNTTRAPLTGTAVFHAEMSWPRGADLPPIAVTEMAGRPVPRVVGDVLRSEDERGRPDRERIAFDIRFAVTDVPANGWKTYLAWFTEDPAPPNAADLPEAETGLIAIETTRHGGDFPASGTF